MTNISRAQNNSHSKNESASSSFCKKDKGSVKHKVKKVSKANTVAVSPVNKLVENSQQFSELEHEDRG